jgi:uncharacterized repeat protein (TIGR02543 family)
MGKIITHHTETPNESILKSHTGDTCVFSNGTKSDTGKVRGFLAAVAFLIVLLLVISAVPVSNVHAAVINNAVIVASSANVRSAPGTTSTIVTKIYQGQRIQAGEVTNITGDPQGYNSWIAISVMVGQTQYNGYVVSSFVQKDAVVDDPAFESMIAGFPESYKPSLRSLHASHPGWVFTAVPVTDASDQPVSWSTAVAAESKIETSLIESSVNDSWKSTDSGMYNWLTDTYTSYYSGQWVNSSSAINAYYMDPRNFLSETQVFQFLDMTFDSSQQVESKIASALSGTFMSGSATVDLSGNSVTYAKSFMDAASASGINPYFLIARSLQEVQSIVQNPDGSYSKIASGSASGTYTGHEGFYNFYNIFASGSNPVANALIFAESGYVGAGGATLNERYLLPWNTQYRAIVGGAKWIAYGFIDKGQNTLYYQKFDVVKNSTPEMFVHQYMQNICAPYSEAANLYQSYSKASLLGEALVFKIPVYAGMPDSATAKPAETGNPNNLLSNLVVDGYSLSPSFNPSVTSGYTVEVPNNVTSVNVLTYAASVKASISGYGVKALAVGNNNFSVTVTAQNGSQCTYSFTVLRDAPSGPMTVTYDSNYQGSALSYASAQYNTLLSAPANPVRSGYTFGGWFKDQACTAAWDFASDKVTSNITLYAKWLAPSVFYLSHVQDIGWQQWYSNGEISGTSGQSRRLEAMCIKLENIDGGVEYKTHVQDYGWMDWVSNAAVSGTSGEGKRLEAIQIRLTGNAANQYDIYYRVHAENFGWMDWASNGASAGTAGYSYRLEAIQIVLVPKGGAAPGSTAKPFADKGSQPVVSYQSHVQDIGWQGFVSNGDISGTSGQAKRLEAMCIKLANVDGGIEYKTHVQDYGWMDWVANGAMSGTSGQAKRLEAIQIRLTGNAANQYDIYYRVHAQNIGWMDWAVNGSSAGTAGYSYRLEAIQVVLVPKGQAAPGPTAKPFAQA